MNKSDLIESDDDEAQQAMSNDLDDFKLPEMDWDSLEAKLKQANQEATIQVNNKTIHRYCKLPNRSNTPEREQI